MRERRVGSGTGRRARGNCGWDIIYEKRIKKEKKSIGNNIYIDNTYICYRLCIYIHTFTVSYIYSILL